jgi:nucleoside-diphosphate-sugar epimerase
VDVIGFRLGFILCVDKSMGRGGSFTNFIKKVATDQPTIMVTMQADSVRPLGYVENVVDLLIKACSVPTPKTRTFNAVEFPVSCRQIAESMMRVNPKAKITIKDGVSSEDATWGGTQELLLNASGIRNELK